MKPENDSFYKAGRILGGLSTGKKLFIAFFVLVTIGIALDDHDKAQAPQPIKTPQDPFLSMSASEHLAEAKKALAEGKPPKTFGRVYDAKQHLAEISKDSMEWKGEGNKLWDEVIKREQEIQKQSAVITAKLMVQQRKDFVKKYELSLLDKGMDTTITAQGKDNTVFKMKYILMSRPLVYQLINNDSFMSNLKNHGFKKAVFTDGYDNTWTVDVK